MNRIIFLCMLLCTYPALAETDFITNRDGSFHLKPVEKKRVNTPFYDLSFVAYDKAFAEEFGLLDDYVTQLDTGLRWMEMRMITEGGSTNCYYNLVLDKSVKIDFPPANFNPKLSPFPMMPQRNLDNLTEKQALNPGSLIKLNTNGVRFMNRIYFGNANFVYHTKGRPWREETGMIGGATLQYYVQDRELPYQIISANIGCSDMAYIAKESAGAPSVWIQKQGHTNETNYPNKENFLRFAIPLTMQNQIKPHLASYKQKLKGN